MSIRRGVGMMAPRHDPDGNGIEVYYEDLELYRRGVWEGGQFPRKLEEAIPSMSHS